MIRILILFTPIILHSQNIDMYMSLIHEGQVDGVKEQLPELISKYPNNPGVLYLQALMTTDGMKSLELYSNLLDKFPESKYSADAALKIGEYFYARGLYTQSAALLKNIPIKYPRFIDIERATSLMVNSFNAIGEADSARYYALIIKSMFPNIDADIDMAKEKNKPLAQVFNFKKKIINLGPYVIQVGAFGSKNTANRLKLQVNQLGHDVSINNVESNGKVLYAVRVNRYKSKKQAEIIGEDIKSKIGIEYRVLYRPVGN